MYIQFNLDKGYILQRIDQEILTKVDIVDMMDGRCLIILDVLQDLGVLNLGPLASRRSCLVQRPNQLPYPK